MKGLEITGENLEDLLAYDDLFLDYFNTFLALPAFPQPLVYNRLAGAFEEVDEVSRDVAASFPGLNPASLHYGATDSERERMLEWARRERLPLFLRTQLFRELKLVKLLLRTLEEPRQSASRGSSLNLRGYSRQTDTCWSSLSHTVSVDSSGHPRHHRHLHHQGLAADDDVDDTWGELDYQALYRYQRPGSCALSLPINFFHGAVTSSSPEGPYYMLTDSTGSKKESVGPCPRPDTSETDPSKRSTRISTNIEVIPSKSGKTRSSQRTKGPPASSTEEAFKRAARTLSAPVSQAEWMEMPPLELPDFDVMFGEEEPEPSSQAFVTFDDDNLISEEQTETDVRNMEGHFRMTLQQMKEHVLCSRDGFERYRDFLKGTSGRALLDFWLDCENFKDTMEDFDDDKQRDMATMLFRDIQDKYKFKLTPDAQEQITRCSTSNIGLSHTIFLRTQYDVLRRLRAYWLPRYLTHCQRTNTLDMETKVTRPVTSGREARIARRQQQLQQPTVFPTISLARSMPVLPDQARHFTFARTCGGEGAGVRRATSSVTSNRSNLQRWFRRSLTSATLRTRGDQTTLDTTTKDRFLLSLAQDRIAGGPFQRYLTKVQEANPELLSSLLFWQDVTEYGATEDRSVDRLLRLCHAWTIYNHYLSQDSPHKLQMAEPERLSLHETLQSATDFVEASVFAAAKTVAVSKLEKAWIRYLKEDLKAFLDCRVRLGSDSPPSTAEVIDITVTDQDLLIKRPRPWVRRVPESTASERARRLQKALQQAEEVDVERLQKKKQEALERRKEMERERRKAVRAAYARLKEAKRKSVAILAVQRRSGEKQASGGGEETQKVAETEKKGTTFVELSTNKTLVSLFRKHLAEDEGNKEVQNMCQLYQDIEAYFNPKDGKLKKDMLATNISKNYLEPKAKKFVDAGERVLEKLSVEKERPRSGTLRDLQRHVLPRVEDMFSSFINRQAAALGVTTQDLANMSQAEMAMRLEPDQSLYTGWQKAGYKGQMRGKGTEPGPHGSEDECHQPGKAQDTHIAPHHSRRARRGKPTGRAQPSREDKNDFLQALGQSASGQPSTLMLHFYKYLLQHGEEDGMPLLDKDLFFYIEVHKFKECSHAYSDDEMMKRKVQSMVDCFLDSVYAPTLQIDISSEIHTKSMKACQRYIGGKEMVATLFDEAQYYVFKELLPYWAGFRKSQHLPDDLSKRPLTKHEKLLRRRQENIQNFQMPSKDIVLPRIAQGAAATYTITLSDGVKCKEISASAAPSPTPPESKEQRGSRMTIAPSLESLALNRKTGSRRTSHVSGKDTLLSRA